MAEERTGVPVTEVVEYIHPNQWTSLDLFLYNYHTAETPATQRRGQFLFNYLFMQNPELADKIRGTSVDPFHQNTRIDACLAYVIQHWNSA